MAELWELGVGALGRVYRSGEASPTEAVAAVLTRIEEVDPLIGAVTSLDPSVEPAARRCEAALRSGRDRGPLHGVPVLVKEVFAVGGLPSDFGSMVLAGNTASEDAAIVRRLRLAGALVIGLARSHEFGWGITTQHASRGSTRNPWDLSRIPGGSSGGSAAAVATGMVPLAVGSDTGGSIRIPSSFCGVSGIKPAFGRVSRWGGVPLAPSLDTAGFVARRPSDLSAALLTASGPDPRDPSTVGLPPIQPAAGRDSLEGMRVGLAPALMDVSLVPAVAARWEQAVATVENLGGELQEVRLPSAADIRGAYVTIQMAEAHHVHTQLLGTWPQGRGSYGADVASRLDLASGVGIRDYLGALAVREEVRAAFDAALTAVDVLLSPISAVQPSYVTDPDQAWHPSGRLPLREAVMGYTVPQNITGLPSVAVPVGLDAHGLPVGVQLTAGVGQELRALAVADLMQDAVDGPLTPHSPSPGRTVAGQPSSGRPPACRS